MKFVADWGECYSVTRELLTGNSPLFLSRVGGSDTIAVACYLEARDGKLAGKKAELMSHYKIVQRFNGYYDLEQSYEKYCRYLAELHTCYQKSQYFTFGHPTLMSLYFPNNVSRTRPNEFKERHSLELLIASIDAAGPEKVGFPYTFVEKLTSHKFTLFNVFAQTLSGKRVLVVSPFAESISLNFGNRQYFFKNFSYPEFSLLLCNTPITYSGLPDHMYPHADWFETTEALKQEISRVDFDIALLSCGSYALPLGCHIERTLGRQAVYVGGVLQLFFGLMGQRYKDAFFTRQINPERFISPVEAGKYFQHVSTDSHTLKEAFGAYF